jgi:hypothetical protein
MDLVVDRSASKLVEQSDDLKFHILFVIHIERPGDESH